MQRMHEDPAPQAAGMMALARNPLRLMHMDMQNDLARAAAVAAPQRGALLAAVLWLVRLLRQAFLSAGSPTSVRRDGAMDDARAGDGTTPRPGGSMLRRME